MTLAAILNRDDGTLSHRHRQTLIDCYNELSSFLSHFENININQLPSSTHQLHGEQQYSSVLPSKSKDLVLINEYLRNAVKYISKIDGFGDIHAEEVLDSVFNRFCIGK